ncbi:hypothetical protein [Bacillus cereus]|uniref:hypothetical protein n=1 Tax=Bacillus cereus TaxID=1396 RepID=UPI001A7EF736|nr:hypothetical protein [Bacillus cereus]
MSVYPNIVYNETNGLPINGDEQVIQVNTQNVSSAISVLTDLFYVHQDTYIGIKTMEFYAEIGLLQDERLVANALEEKRAFD